MIVGQVTDFVRMSSNPKTTFKSLASNLQQFQSTNSSKELVDDANIWQRLLYEIRLLDDLVPFLPLNFLYMDLILNY